MGRRALIALILAGAATSAHAEDNDIVLSRLGTPVLEGDQVIGVVGNNQAFRSLASELGVVMAPRLVEPADTIGFGGFQFTVDTAFTSISSGAGYWDTLEAESNGFMPTVGVFARKGMWFPLPSFEIGIGAVKLLESRMWSAQGYAKFALHEGYHNLPVPSVAVRGAVSRLMGSEQLDLTVASLDVSVSKEFGLGGMINLAPYGGWNLLTIVPRSEVVDRTPGVDQITEPTDRINSFVFLDQDNIYRNRFFAGMKLKYHVFMLALEANLALAGTSVDDRAGTDTMCDAAGSTEDCDAKDAAASQQTYTVTVGFDW